MTHNSVKSAKVSEKSTVSIFRVEYEDIYRNIDNL